MLLNYVKMMLIVLIDIHRSRNHFKALYLFDKFRVLMAYFICEVHWATYICRNLGFKWDNTKMRKFARIAYVTFLNSNFFKPIGLNLRKFLQIRMVVKYSRYCIAYTNTVYEFLNF